MLTLFSSILALFPGHQHSFVESLFGRIPALSENHRPIAEPVSSGLFQELDSHAKFLDK
jgi:hypothetical protein